MSLKLRFTVLLLLCLAPHAYGATYLTASIDESQVVPPTGSAGTGSGSFILDPVANTLSYEITFSGLGSAETLAHIHGPANVGSNGAVLFDLGTGTPKVGVWNFPQFMEANILAGLTYVNIHTTGFPGGEIRGQILVNAAAIELTATLDGVQPVPPTGSSATGSGTFFLDQAANTLAFRIDYSGLGTPEPVGHIHGPAAIGSIGGILFGLAPITGSPKIGVWSFSEAEEADILAGLTYVNLHTSAFPGGEIRGQILDLASVSVDGPEGGIIPATFALHANRPNPFNPTTRIRFDLAEPGQVVLSVYDIVGRLVTVLESGFRDAGSFTGTWDGKDSRGNDVSSGTYIAHMRSGRFEETRQMTLVR